MADHCGPGVRLRGSDPAGGASSTTFGVADDAGKYSEDGGASFFHMLTDLGMTENRMARLLGSRRKPNTDLRPGVLRPCRCRRRCAAASR